MSNVFPLSESFKVIGTDGRISGQWHVLLPSKPEGRTWITAHDVTIYDETLRSGIVAYSADLAAHVLDGTAHLGRIAERIQYDVEDVEAELHALLVEIARVAAADGRVTA